MLATPEDEMAGTLSFASLIDATACSAVATEQHHVFIVEMFIENGDSVVKSQ
jgi:hypothetical protein